VKLSTHVVCTSLTSLTYSAVRDQYEATQVWLMLEEKKVPYRIEKINMRSYGDKPQWFLDKISSGLLPVIELDGEMITESLVIMQIIEREFPAPEYPALIPGSGSEGFERANGLLKLERNLFSEWCGLIFRPSGPSLFGGGAARKNLEATLDKVNEELGVAAGPWFLGGELPSIVDMQYVSHVERMVASCLYWKGMQIRGEGAQRWPNIERWFDAFEQRPSYQATMSDFYTHVRDIPPQVCPALGPHIHPNSTTWPRVGALRDNCSSKVERSKRSRSSCPGDTDYSILNAVGARRGFGSTGRGTRRTTRRPRGRRSIFQVRATHGGCRWTWARTACSRCRRTWTVARRRPGRKRRGSWWATTRPWHASPRAVRGRPCVCASSPAWGVSLASAFVSSEEPCAHS